ncbi:hypothetical protein C8R43DRAFT_590112 [Mycena crocata]|nr:hypothetical protein C8R43DRAFT_590112 [Mycena crocata]
MGSCKIAGLHLQLRCIAVSLAPPLADCCSSSTLRRSSLTASPTLRHSVAPDQHRFAIYGKPHSLFRLLGTVYRLIARDGFSGDVWTLRGLRSATIKVSDGAASICPPAPSSVFIAQSIMAPAFELDATLGLGVTELGIFAALILFGMLVLQVHMYYICNSDRMLVKILVAGVFALEAAHTISIAQVVYYLTVTLADVKQKPGTVYGMSFGMVFETLITFCVQTYFIHRVYRFTQNPWLGATIFALCLLRFIGGVGLSVGSFLNLPHEPDYFSLQDRLPWLVTVTFGVGAAVDVAIAVALCVHVYRWSAAPAMKTTSQLIRRIMYWSIQTGLITSIASVAVVVCFQTMRHNYVWIGIFAILGKLYSNSLLASLNIRALHRNLDANNYAGPTSFALFTEDSVGIRTTDVELALGSTGDVGAARAESTCAHAQSSLDGSDGPADNIRTKSPRDSSTKSVTDSTCRSTTTRMATPGEIDLSEVELKS